MSDSLTLQYRHILTQVEARNSSECIGCGQPNPAGCIVCWDCFKHREDVTPLKWFGGTFFEWQQMAIPTWAMIEGGGQ